MLTESWRTSIDHGCSRDYNPSEMHDAMSDVCPNTCLGQEMGDKGVRCPAKLACELNIVIGYEMKQYSIFRTSTISFTFIHFTQYQTSPV